MTITLTREEAQQVLEHLDDLADFQQWDIDMHVTQYGEEYKPHRVKHMREQLSNTNNTIETLRARLSAPEPEEKKYTEESCPVCGYYCLGKGGVNCIDKPKLCGINTTPPQRDFKFSTIDEDKQPAPAPAGKPQLTDDETRFAEAFTALIKAGYGKEAEIVLKSKKREWQGLTDDEIYDSYSEPCSDSEMVAFAREIEAKLKEKNT